VFISLDFSGGLDFSAGPFTHPVRPSLPIAYFIVVMLFCYGALRGAVTTEFLFYVLLVIIAIIELTQGLTRQLALVFGMIVPLVLVVLLNNRELNTDVFFRQLRLVIYTIVVIKFTTDMALGRGLSSEAFILPNIRIYNYYDYFPVSYSMVSCLCIHSIVNRNEAIKSYFVFIICVLFVFNSQSRLAMLLIALIPVNFVLSKLLVNRLVFFVYGFLLFSVAISLTIILPLLTDGINI